MNRSYQRFLDEFDDIVNESQVFLFITRDAGLQQKEVARLEEMSKSLAREKARAVAERDEDLANVLLGCEFVTKALIAELSMWMLLKQERPDEAWNKFVDSQDYFDSAIRSHSGFGHLAAHVERLNAMEVVVFPPQVFLGSGMVVDSQICSICGTENEDCPHIKGRPYMGELCSVILTPSRIDHVSLVENPANKRCRITKFSVEGDIETA